MTDIRLDDVQPGMVLSRQATGKNGHVLLKEGVTLTDRHLSLLRAHGVTQIDAKLPGKESTQEITMSAEEASMLVEQQFKNNDTDHPLIQELKRVCRNRRQRNPLGGPDDQ